MKSTRRRDSKTYSSASTNWLGIVIFVTGVLGIVIEVILGKI